jgi:hypothetical protein
MIGIEKRYQVSVAEYFTVLYDGDDLAEARGNAELSDLNCAIYENDRCIAEYHPKTGWREVHQK